jgi:hypothetical protein
MYLQKAQKTPSADKFCRIISHSYDTYLGAADVWCASRYVFRCSRCVVRLAIRVWVPQACGAPQDTSMSGKKMAFNLLDVYKY